MTAPEVSHINQPWFNVERNYQETRIIKAILETGFQNFIYLKSKNGQIINYITSGEPLQVLKL